MRESMAGTTRAHYHAKHGRPPYSRTKLPTTSASCHDALLLFPWERMRPRHPRPCHLAVYRRAPSPFRRSQRIHLHLLPPPSWRVWVWPLALPLRHASASPWSCVSSSGPNWPWHSSCAVLVKPTSYNKTCKLLKTCLLAADGEKNWGWGERTREEWAWYVWSFLFFFPCKRLVSTSGSGQLVISAKPAIYTVGGPNLTDFTSWGFKTFGIAVYNVNIRDLKGLFGKTPIPKFSLRS